VPGSTTSKGTYLVAAHSDSIISLDVDENLNLTSGGFSDGFSGGFEIGTGPETVDSTIEVFTIDSDYAYSAHYNLIVLSNQVKEIIEVIDSDENSLLHKPHTEVYDSDFDDYYYYTQISHNEIIVTDQVLDGEGDTLKLRYYFHIPEINSYSNDDDLSIPVEYKNVIIYGTLLHMFRKKDFFDEGNVQFYNTKYLSALGDTQDTVYSRFPVKGVKPLWTY
jgi:hypothetical protein